MTVYIGCGAGFAGDRFDAASPIIAELASRDAPKYLMFECLAERTLASAQLEKVKDPTKGYSPFLDQYFTRHLGPAMAAGVKIVTNLGAANPLAGAHRVRWDGRAATGEAVASGVYFYELKAEGFRAVRRLALLK